MTDQQIKKGSLALCSLQHLGLITSDVPEEVTYSDGSKAMAWRGVKLAPNPGSEWTSRNPHVVADEYVLVALKDFLSMHYSGVDYIIPMVEKVAEPALSALNTRQKQWEYPELYNFYRLAAAPVWQSLITFLKLVAKTKSEAGKG